MAYSIEIMPVARAQLAKFSARDRRLLQEAIAARLRAQPTILSRAIKRLRPNPVASYELRVGDLRVMYDVDATSATVTLKVFGRKVGNTLMVEDEAFREHQNDPTQPTGDGPDNDAQ
jgi:mRNA-degrading endonuclease RelE of RelBE toxin-antitoxin system